MQFSGLYGVLWAEWDGMSLRGESIGGRMSFDKNVIIMGIINWFITFRAFYWTFGE